MTDHKHKCPYCEEICESFTDPISGEPYKDASGEMHWYCPSHGRWNPRTVRMRKQRVPMQVLEDREVYGEGE